MAAGENSLLPARAIGKTMAVPLAKSHNGEVIAFGKFAKITQRRSTVSCNRAEFYSVSIFLYYSWISNKAGGRLDMDKSIGK